MESLVKYTLIGLIAFVGIILIGLIQTIPIFFLWNWLMPQLFGVTSITFWEAIGVSLLAAFLFKSSGSSSK